MNENTMPLPTDNPLDTNPRLWLETAHKFFLTLGSQGATEVVASYQTAHLLSERLFDDFEQQDLQHALDVIKDAAVARMRYLIASTSNRSDRRRLRKLFNAVTRSGNFMSIWDCVGP